MELLCRNLEHQQIDFCFITETHYANDIHTHYCRGYRIFSTITTRKNQGGVAIVYKDNHPNPNWHVESERRHGGNVISAILVSGSKQTPVVGAYLPPDGPALQELPYLTEALERFKNSKTAPVLLGDLNADIHNPQPLRNQQLGTVLATYGFHDLLSHYKQRRRFKHRTTYFQWRDNLNRVIRTRTDYILATDRRLFEYVSIRDPRYFDSDHYMITARLLASPTPSHKGYLRGRRQQPFTRAKENPSQADSLLDTVKAQCPPPKQQHGFTRPCWFSPKTIQLMDTRCALRRNPKHSRTLARQLTRETNASIKIDRPKRCEDAGARIAACFPDDHQESADLQGAYNILQAWYKHSGDRPPKPSRQDLESRTEEFATPHAATPPPGDPIPCSLPSPYDIDDSIPSRDEIKEATSRLKNNKAPGPSGMRAEHIKDWVKLAFPEEYYQGQGEPPPPQPEPFDALVELIQHMWRTGELPQELTWQCLACLPKPCGGTRGIGLLEIIWKLTEAIMDTRLKEKVKLHDLLHGFKEKRGTTTAIIEAKLQQELAHLPHKPLFQVFLDLTKAYDTADRPRLLQTLKDYGVGPCFLRLLKAFWDHQQIVAKQSGFYGPLFTASRGGTQGSLVFPEIFNIMIDNIVRHWLTLVIGPERHYQREGLGDTVATKLAAFYADDGLISSTDAPWLQSSLDTLVGLFHRVGLDTNITKTKVMLCYPATIHVNQSEEAYILQTTGEGRRYAERQ